MDSLFKGTDSAKSARKAINKGAIERRGTLRDAQGLRKEQVQESIDKQQKAGVKVGMV